LPLFSSEKYTSALASLSDSYASNPKEFDVEDETLLNFLEVAMDRVHFNAETIFSTHQITSIVRSLSVIHYSDPSLFDHITTNHLDWYLDNASVRDLASLVTSFNVLGYGPGAAFFEGISSRSEVRRRTGRRTGAKRLLDL
jgi:hypothetical protein